MSSNDLSAAKQFFLFAPGAGAPASHPWMRDWTEVLRTIAPVETFDYDYMKERRKRPDRLPKLIGDHRKALHHARDSHPRAAAILIGKSMGGRVGCHVSLEEDVAGVICLGYPLCGGGDPTKLRDQILREISTPILFVQGTRDPLCPLDLLEGVRKEMRASNDLYVVEGGDHSVAVSKAQLKASNETQAVVNGRVLHAIAKFVAEQTGGIE
jgi:predicted alpha/beta-hydrolase family hydrolase